MQQLFDAFGLSQKESAVLLKLIELGAQPVSVIARHAGIPRSSMYFVLERLEQSGFVQAFERAGIRYVKAIPVQSMPDMLLSQQKQLGAAAEALESRLPDLLKLENALSITPTVRFLEGKKAVSALYEGIVRQQRDFCALLNPQALQEVLPQQYEALAKMVASSGVKVKELLVRGPEAAAYRKKYSSARHQIRLLPQGMTFPSDTIVCGDQLFMIACGDNQVCATVVVSQSLATTQRSVFDQLWLCGEAK